MQWLFFVLFVFLCNKVEAQLDPVEELVVNSCFDTSASCTFPPSPPPYAECQLRGVIEEANLLTSNDIKVTYNLTGCDTCGGCGNTIQLTMGVLPPLTNPNLVLFGLESSPITILAPTTGSNTVMAVSRGTVILFSTALNGSVYAQNTGTLSLNSGSSITGALSVQGEATASLLTSGINLDGNVTVDAGSTFAASNTDGSCNMTGNLDVNGQYSVKVNHSKVGSVLIDGSATFNGDTSIGLDMAALPPDSFNDVLFLQTSSGITFQNTSLMNINANLPSGFQIAQGGNNLYLSYFMSPSPPPPSIPTYGTSGNNSTVILYLNNNLPDSVINALNTSGATPNQIASNLSPGKNQNTTVTSQHNQVYAGGVTKQASHTKLTNNAACAFLFDDSVQEYLVADAVDDLTSLMAASRKPSKSTYGLSFSAIGDYLHQKAEKGLPAYSALTGGGLLAFEYYGVGQGLLGINAGYSYTHVYQDQNAGSSQINQGMASIYGLYVYNQFYTDVSLGGGLNETRNWRNILLPGFRRTAVSNFHNWQLMPHIEVGYDIIYQNWGMEPFADLDWINNWQVGYRERGAGDFDMAVSPRYSSLLRSEVGLRFYEFWKLDWGWLFIKEMAGYVNKEFFKTGLVTAGLVGVFDTFTVDSTNDPQNLASVSLDIVAVPNSRDIPYVSFTYCAEFSVPFQAHEAMLRVIKKF